MHKVYKNGKQEKEVFLVLMGHCEKIQVAEQDTSGLGDNPGKVRQHINSS